METEAETGGRRPPAQGGTPEPPEAGGGVENTPLEPLQGAQPWDPLTSDAWSPGPGGGGVCDALHPQVCGSPRGLLPASYQIHTC